jgi:hypothetical protein
MLSFINVIVLVSNMVGLSLGPESLAKMAGECLPGCGECCYFVFPSYANLEAAEELATVPMPQFPGKGFFNSKFNMKKLWIKYGKQEEVLGPVCPFLYAADLNYQAFKVESTSIKKEVLDVLDGSNALVHHLEETMVTVIVDGAPDYTLLCGVHEQVKKGGLAGKGFDRCREWKYEPDHDKQENETCLRGIAKLGERLFSGK